MVHAMHEYEDLKIAFLSVTPMAGMPYRTMQVCRPFCAMAEEILGTPGYKGDRVFPYRHLFGTPEAEEVMHNADMFITTSYFKDDKWGIFAMDKPIATHYSTEHFRWKNKAPNPRDATVVAQYQARFAPQLKVLPNCIPIDDERFMPGEKPTDRVVILYTPTTRSGHGWSSKGFAKTFEVLRILKGLYKDRVEIVLLENRPYEEVLRARRHAHICIDECVTGSYHSTALESLSAGCVTICWMDSDTEDAWYKLGQDTIPFNLCTMSKLRPHLEALIENPDYLEMQCRQARNWMVRNYSEQWQAEKWLKWHKAFLMRSGKAKWAEKS